MHRPISKKRSALVVGGAVGLLGLGLAIPAVAAAQDPTPSPSSSASASPGADRGQAERAERQAKLAEALAKELNLPADRVAAALAKVQEQLAAEAKTEQQNRLKERLDQAVTEGKLTQEQADAILKASEAGVLGGFGGPGGHHGPGHPR